MSEKAGCTQYQADHDIGKNPARTDGRRGGESIMMLRTKLAKIQPRGVRAQAFAFPSPMRNLASQPVGDLVEIHRDDVPIALGVEIARL